MFLQNNGGFDQTQYGYFVYSDFMSGVESWDPSVSGDTGYFFISDHFIVVPDPYEGATGGVQLDMHDSYGDYVWLDVEPSLLETGGTSSINYRFIFEYS
jgi:hypothetical protein